MLRMATVLVTSIAFSGFDAIPPAHLDELKKRAPISTPRLACRQNIRTDCGRLIRPASGLKP
jgi:hypothetical protein